MEALISLYFPMTRAEVMSLRTRYCAVLRQVCYISTDEVSAFEYGAFLASREGQNNAVNGTTVGFRKVIGGVPIAIGYPCAVASVDFFLPSADADFIPVANSL